MERVRHPEIASIELADVRMGGQTLWQSIQGRGFPFALRQVLHAFQSIGTGAGLKEAVPAVAVGFEAVFVTGGQMEDRKQRAWLSGLNCPIVFGWEPVFGGVPGGIDLLNTRGLDGWVADLGQTQLKLATPGSRWVFPRDWTRLRAAGQVPPTEIPAQRRRLREFIALKLQMVMAENARRPRALVFALPARLADDGTPGGSSYAGMSGDRMLLPDALELAGLASLPLFVLNDAELSALSARLDERLAGFRKVLVLTLGFGIGAALIHRHF
jgi:hypothetical protein